MNSNSNLLKALGPGILMAGAAVGGSHLVASTQAGALFGWRLMIVLLLVNLFKYPFFLYGERYTAATGETILHGYRRMGIGYLLAFFVLNLANAVLAIAGVSFITGALALNFGLRNLADAKTLAAGIAILCALIVVLGRYHWLDKTTKAIMFLLSASTAAAILMAVLEGPAGDPDFVGPSPWTLASIGFLIQFMGWMPAPIDVGAWPSLWMASRAKETGHRATMREAMIDFHIGYVGTVVLAVFFLALGTLVMHGTGRDFGTTGLAFASTFIGMYSETIGLWAEPIIVVAAFTTMLSTTLTCIDAYPRSLAMSTALMLRDGERRFPLLHVAWIAFAIVVGTAIILFFTASMGQLLYVAMVVSFSTSPVFAYINYRVMRREWVPEAYHPGIFLRVLSWAGMTFLTVSTLVFVYWLLWID